MAVSTTNTTSTVSTTSSNTVVSNPSAALDKDAFLKLLLIEMQHQDPTEPMDSDKMLTQTSQLAALEMQQNTNTTMQQMVETMTQLSEVMLASGNTSMLNALGKMAKIGDDKIKITSQGQSVDVRMHLPKATKDGATFQVLNSSGEVIREFKVEKDKLQEGTNVVSWDGKDNNGNYVSAGDYTVKATYTDVDGGTSTSTYGAYPIESVKFIDGVPWAQLAGKYVKFEQIGEIIA